LQALLEDGDVLVGPLDELLGVEIPDETERERVGGAEEQLGVVVEEFVKR
jgi:hypothetical protein